jgi:HK97 gp10 family phage protein
MADTVSFSLIGIDELLAKLETVSYDVKRKGGRFALRKAAGVVEKALKQNAKQIDDPQSAADISKNVAVRFSKRTFDATGDLKFRVGIMGGAGGRDKTANRAGLPGGDTRHFRHVEFGTEKMAAKPFMRRALEDNIGPATNEFINQYEKSIDRAIRRAARGR